MNTLLENPQELIAAYVIPWSINIVTALIIFVIGRMVAKVIVKAVRKILQKSNVDTALLGFLGNILYAVLLIVVVIAALEQLGVKTTSLLAIFATAGLAVGLALKDQLSNFAAGVMLIMFKPFKVGDFVEAGGTSGVVEAINIFNTLMRTGDNREITLPNSQIFNGTITNVTARDTRRIDLTIGIGYSDNIGQAKNVLKEILDNENRILPEPAPAILVSELGESSVDFAVRPWVKASDYWTVRSDLLEKIKTEFDTRGISIPFPQRDVHLYQAAAND
jgi:small conductance mechanosensitive channel